MICFASIPLSAQSTLTVADGTSTNQYVPIYGYYSDAYLRSQIIYPASMLSSMSGSAISSMSFYFDSIPEYDWNSIYAVRMQEVSTSTFNSTAYIPTTNAMTVYTGLLYNVGGVMGINFDLPFNYFGGNLLVEFVSVNPGEYYAACSFFGINSPNSSMQGYSYTMVPGDNSTPTSQDFLPKTTFAYGTANYCETPMGLSATVLNPYDVTLHWTGNNHALSYTVQYMLANQTNWSNAVEVSVTDTSVLLTNLQPSTVYQFRVNSVCNNSDTSYWSSAQTFSMLNIPVTAPYFQDFETSPNNISDFYFTHTGDNGWNIGQATCVLDSTFSVGHSLYISDNFGLTNTYAFNSGSYSYATMDISFDSLQAEWHLAFDYKVTGESPYWDYFSVYMTGGETPVPNEGVPDGTALLNQATGITEWTHFDVLLDSVFGANKRIIFFWNNDSSLGNNPPAAVDNISVYAVTPVEMPTVVTEPVNTIQHTSAVLNATITNPDNLAITNKGFEWKVSTASDYAQVPGTGNDSTFTCTLANLTSNTDYTVRAYITCNETTIYGNEETFTTLADQCNAPTNINGYVSDTTVHLSWNWTHGPEFFTEFLVSYRPQGTEDWTTVSAPSNGCVLYNLIPDTYYEVYVVTVCNNGLTSEPSSIYVFQSPTGIPEWLGAKVSLYPNPASEHIDLRVDGDLIVTGIEVFDVYNKLISAEETVRTPSLQTRINITSLANGIYFVRITTDHGAVTKPFIKK